MSRYDNFRGDDRQTDRQTNQLLYPAHARGVIIILHRVFPKAGYLGAAPPLQVTVGMAGENVLSWNNTST